MELCQGPRTETKRPSVTVPPGSCDCHMHIFGPESAYPYTADRNYTPPDALPPNYLRMLGTLGLERMVVVQASVYGCDNRRTAAAVSELGLKRARGIGMVEQDVSPKTLRELTDAGLKGTRFITTVKGGPTLDHLRGVAEKIAEFGWHIEMYVPRNLWGEGSSSMLVFLNNFPSGVKRGSLRILKTGPLTSLRGSTCASLCSASGTMVRNLKMRNLRLFSPSLSCVKKIGPGEVSLIKAAVITNTGMRTTNKHAEIVKSSARFAAAPHPWSRPV